VAPPPEACFGSFTTRSKAINGIVGAFCFTFTSGDFSPWLIWHPSVALPPIRLQRVFIRIKVRYSTYCIGWRRGCCILYVMVTLLFLSPWLLYKSQTSGDAEATAEHSVPQETSQSAARTDKPIEHGKGVLAEDNN
jgi:hypothetical protein